MALAARLGPLADAEARQGERNRLRLDASLGPTDAGSASDVVLQDLSADGFLAQTADTLPVGSRVWLEVAGVDRLSARIRWRGSSTIGCEFDSAISPEVLAAAVKRSRVIWADFPANHSAEPESAVAAGAAAEVVREPDENDDRWSVPRRAVFLLGTSIVLWSIVILAIRALWAVIA